MYFLGSVSGTSGAYSNQMTGASGVAPFLIPKGTRSIYLEPGVAGLRFEFGGNTSGSGGSFQTTRTRGALLTGTGLINGPFRVPRTDQFLVVSIYNEAGGSMSCRVFAAPEAP